MKKLLNLSKCLFSVNKLKFSNINQTQQNISKSLSKIVQKQNETKIIDSTVDEVLQEQGFILNELKNKNFYELHKKVQETDIYIHFQPRFVEQLEQNEEEEQKEEQQQDEQQKEPLDFQIYIVKNDQCLLYECNTDYPEIQISKIIYHDSFKKLRDSNSIYQTLNIYEGPEFSSLDEKVQQYFYNYLKQHGINEDTTSIIEHLSETKENEKYLKWLDQLKDFIDK